MKKDPQIQESNQDDFVLLGSFDARYTFYHLENRFSATKRGFPICLEKQKRLKTAGITATSGWIKEKKIGKIIGFSRSTVSKFKKRFDPWENIENKP